MIDAPKRHVAAEPIKKSNKFRLVVFEGDFSDESVSEIAQALTSPLKPSTDAIALKVKQEFAAKEKAKVGKEKPQAVSKPSQKRLITGRPSGT